MLVTVGYINTSGEPDCTCRYCEKMSVKDRMTRGMQIHDVRRRAGQIRAAQTSAALSRAKGFQSVMERRPDCSLWLKKRIRSHNKRKASELGITATQYKKRRVAELREIYVTKA